jgi:hypothetical protein
MQPWNDVRKNAFLDPYMNFYLDSSPIHRRRYHTLVIVVVKKGGLLAEREDRGRRKGLPRPDWDSGDVKFSPLQPGDPWEWRTLRHNLGSTNLLVEAKFGGENSQGAVEWFVPAQILFRFRDANAVMVG